MKRFLMYGLCAGIIVLTLSAISFAEEYNFSAKKTVIRIEKPDEIVECIVSAEDRNLFAYKAQLVYDKEMFEFIEAKPIYIQGEPQPIKYMSENLPEGISYNVPNSKVYKNNDVKCGYYGDEIYPGMYRSISSIMGFEGRTEGNAVLQITLKSKKSGDSFIYLTDEETSSLNEDKSVTANVIKTVLTVKGDNFSTVATEINDMDDIAYPWRKSETFVLQQANTKKNIEEMPEGVHYDINYENNDIELNVLPDGTVVCSVPMKIQSGIIPVVVRNKAFGGFKQISRIRYDDEASKLIFAIDDFGEHIIADGKYSVEDCAENSDEFEAVCYLKSIGVIDKNSNNFFPYNNITRAEFLKMLISCLGEADTSAVVWFKDVSIADWYYKYIATAANKGIITVDTEYFYPNSAISGQDAERMLQKVSEIINGSNEILIDKKENLTRGDAAVAIQNMLWLKLQ